MEAPTTAATPPTTPPRTPRSSAEVTPKRSPPSVGHNGYATDADSPTRKWTDSDADNLLETLAESLLLQVAERDVEIEAQAERHAHELTERKWLAATPMERAWLGLPWWVHAMVATTIFFGIVLVP